jgi:hypothetical protein
MSQPLTRCGQWEMAQGYSRTQIEDSEYDAQLQKQKRDTASAIDDNRTVLNYHGIQAD